MPRNSTYTKLVTIRSLLQKLRRNSRHESLKNARRYIHGRSQNANFRHNIGHNSSIGTYFNQVNAALNRGAYQEINMNHLNRIIRGYEAISSKPNENMVNAPAARRNNAPAARRNNAPAARRNNTPAARRRNVLARAAEARRSGPNAVRALAANALRRRRAATVIQRAARARTSRRTAAATQRTAATRLVGAFRNFSERMKDAILYTNLQPRFYRIEWKAGSTMHYKYYNPKTMARSMGLTLPQNSTHNAAEQAVNAQLQHMGPRQRVMNNPFTRGVVERRQVSKRTRRGRINGAPPAPPAPPAGHPYPHLWALHHQPPPQVPPPPSASMLFGHHY